MDSPDSFPLTAADVLPDVLDQLPATSPPVRQTARAFAEVLSETMWANGKSPTAIAATCVYAAGLLHGGGHKLGQAEISDHADVGEVTIRKHYVDVPMQFYEHADEWEYERFDSHYREGLVERIEYWYEAETSGKPINRIDPWGENPTVPVID